MQLFSMVLLPMAVILPPRAWAGEIIGGWEVQPHSRSYMAYLKTQGRIGRSCGGFLVSSYFVLTAAHCNGDEITVRLGAHNIRKQERSQQVIRARYRIPHPEYDDETYENDIMLLKLAQRVNLNRWVKTIPLPHARQTVRPGTVCTVAGWGKTSMNSQSGSDTLREVDVVVQEDAACRHHHRNTSRTVCAGNPGEGRSPFKGDSGGPLVCGLTAQGIASLSYMNRSSLGLYTRISTFLPWIQENMRRLQP